MIRISILVTLGGRRRRKDLELFSPSCQPQRLQSPKLFSLPTPTQHQCSLGLAAGFRGKIDFPLLHLSPHSTLPLHSPFRSRIMAQYCPHPDIFNRLSPLCSRQCQAGGLELRGSPARGICSGGSSAPEQDAPELLREQRCSDAAVTLPSPAPPRGRCSPYCSQPADNSRGTAQHGRVSLLAGVSALHPAPSTTPPPAKPPVRPPRRRRAQRGDPAGAGTRTATTPRPHLPLRRLPQRGAAGARSPPQRSAGLGAPEPAVPAWPGLPAAACALLRPRRGREREREGRKHHPPAFLLLPAPRRRVYPPALCGAALPATRATGTGRCRLPCPGLGPPPQAMPRSPSPNRGLTVSRQVPPSFPRRKMSRARLAASNVYLLKEAAPRGAGALQGGRQHPKGCAAPQFLPTCPLAARPGRIPGLPAGQGSLACDLKLRRFISQ